MKHELKLIFVIFVGFIALLWFEKPLKALLLNYDLTELNAKLISGIFMRSLIVAISLWIIKKLGFIKYNGLENGIEFTNLSALAIPSIFILFGLMSNSQTFLSTNPLVLLLFLASVLTIGFVEELVFRGTILPLFINYFREKKNVLFWSVFLTSSIFGIIHFINIFKEPENILGITHQVFFAISIGVFFGGLMLKSKNIVIPSLFHGLVNFAFGAGELNPTSSQVVVEKVSEGINWSSVIPTTIFFTFILLAGVNMIKKVDRKTILENLDRWAVQKEN